MAMYGIEFNDKVKSFECPHCGEESMTVWGWVSKDSAAHAVYFVNLMTGHQEISARFTISVCGWGEEDDYINGSGYISKLARLPLVTK
jgi:hypothetical protein